MSIVAFATIGVTWLAFVPTNYLFLGPVVRKNPNQLLSTIQTSAGYASRWKLGHFLEMNKQTCAFLLWQKEDHVSRKCPNMPDIGRETYCTRCQATDHFVRDCKQPVRCRRCNQTGHPTHMCTTKRGSSPGYNFIMLCEHFHLYFQQLEFLFFKINIPSA